MDTLDTMSKFREPWFDEDGQTYWPTVFSYGGLTLGILTPVRWNLVCADSQEKAYDACPLSRGVPFSAIDVLTPKEWEARGFRTKAGWEKDRKARAKKAEARAAAFKAALVDLTALVEAMRVELQAVHADVKALRGQHE